MSEETKNDKWLVVGASVIGKSHIADNLPCQDNHLHCSLKNNWGIAVVADGAGSAANSDKGSAFVVKATVKAFAELLEKEKWNIQNTLPDEATWTIAAKQTLKEVRAALDFFAEENEWEVSSLACTVIAAIYSPVGILLTHIGDGRAAVQQAENKEWVAAMTPHKGEEANQTVFITSEIWQEDELELSEVQVPESRMIDAPVMAFALLSDGCEKHSFECSRFDEELQRWSDPNRPFPRFFNPLTANLSSAMEQGIEAEDIEEKWTFFLEGGTKGLKQEGDDKTMILGVFPLA